MLQACTSAQHSTAQHSTACFGKGRLALQVPSLPSSTKNCKYNSCHIFGKSTVPTGVHGKMVQRHVHNCGMHLNLSPAADRTLSSSSRRAGPHSPAKFVGPLRPGWGLTSIPTRTAAAHKPGFPSCSCECMTDGSACRTKHDEQWRVPTFSAVTFQKLISRWCYVCASCGGRQDPDKTDTECLQ